MEREVKPIYNYELFIFPIHLATYRRILLGSTMTPAGYMFKRVATKPAHLDAAVVDIYSVSNCISENFADFINYWKHNGYWLFDRPEIIEELSEQENLDLSRTTLFYYEVYEYEFDEYNETDKWIAFVPEQSFKTEVQVPIVKHLQGFDVVSFYVHTSPECSPLSCNALAQTVAVNQHCLFNTFEEAYNALNCGFFENSEPGPYRIFSVYLVNKNQSNPSNEL
jgi:hypothetical protein